METSDKLRASPQAATLPARFYVSCRHRGTRRCERASGSRTDTPGRYSNAEGLLCAFDAHYLATMGE